jgi:hypothetical protein
MRCPLAERECTRNCPFWVNGECLVEGIDLRGRDDVTHWLEDLRNELARAPNGASFHASLARGRE